MMPSSAKSMIPVARLLSMANVISLARAALAPIILYLLVRATPTSLLAALVLALIAGGSDLVDGYIARRHGAPSDLGRYVDGASDAIFHLAVFMAFLANAWIGIWTFVAIFFAEVIVTYFGIFTKQIGQPFGVRWSAWLKSTLHPVAQIAVIAAALARPEAPQESVVFGLAVGIAVLASLTYVADHAVCTLRRLSGGPA